MMLKNKLALLGVGILGVTGIGAGVAAAQTSPSSTPPSAPAAPAPTPAPNGATQAQVGEQTAPDTPAEKAAEANGAEKAETPGTEKESATEEPGDAALPGGGHADPAGQNVDHQFEGVE
jgi:type IV secretory pathway VirB10-like protein